MVERRKEKINENNMEESLTTPLLIRVTGTFLFISLPFILLDSEILHQVKVVV